MSHDRDNPAERYAQRHRDEQRKAKEEKEKYVEKLEEAIHYIVCNSAGGPTMDYFLTWNIVAAIMEKYKPQPHEEVEYKHEQEEKGRGGRSV